MELRHLRYFVAVAEAENVTRAAAKLHVAQPAVSRQIRDLEEELGFPLLERSAKAVRLTDAGRVFLVEACAVLQRAEAAVAAARSVADGLSGELHVGYAPSLTVQILPRALRSFQAAYPRVRVVLHDYSTEEMLAGLNEKKLHVALVVKPDPEQLRGLRFKELATYPLCIAMAPTHPLAGSRTVSFAKTVGEPFIGYSRTGYPEYHTSMSLLFGKVGRVPEITEEHDSVTSLIAAVEAGRGVALVPDCLACMVGARLKIIPVTPAPPPIVVGAVFRADAESVAVEKFVAAATEPPSKS